MKQTITFHSLGWLQRLKWRLSVNLQAWRRQASVAAPPDYDIAVTTYIARFDTYFKSLLSQLHFLFPDRRITVVANGHYDRPQQEDYLARLRKLTGGYPNVTLIAHSAPVGLARMWNEAIRASRSGRILMLNDDLYLMSHFRSQIEGADLPKKKMATINGSWSHFWIVQEIIDTVGWFDERFVEIGYEDLDYEARLACNGVTVDRIELNGVWNCVDQPSEYSYGVLFEIADGKYSSKNRRRFCDKWEVSDYETSGSFFVSKLGRWVKLRKHVESSPPC